MRLITIILFVALSGVSTFRISWRIDEESDSFICGSGEIIPKPWMCDNDYDCTDGSDEADCIKGSVSKKAKRIRDEAPCKVGNVIFYYPARFMCDGEVDCPDGSDERNCHSSRWFLCASGFRIRKQWVCDGEIDCDDGTDEFYCDPFSEKRGKNDESNEESSDDKREKTDDEYSYMFTCGSSELEIPKKFVCNGKNDCPDGSDENNCLNTNGLYTCRSGLTIIRHLVCDGKKHCADGSDEESCTIDEPNSSTSTTGIKIPRNSVCDETNNCIDTNDEENFVEISVGKTDDEMFTCSSAEQILRTFVCDGDNDCDDGSDEINCNLKDKTNGSDTFACSSDVEIPRKWVCDGDTDCQDGLDESNCPFQDEIAEMLKT